MSRFTGWTKLGMIMLMSASFIDQATAARSGGPSSSGGGFLGSAKDDAMSDSAMEQKGQPARSSSGAIRAANHNAASMLDGSNRVLSIMQGSGQSTPPTPQALSKNVTRATPIVAQMSKRESALHQQIMQLQQNPMPEQQAALTNINNQLNGSLKNLATANNLFAQTTNAQWRNMSAAQQQRSVQLSQQMLNLIQQTRDNRDAAKNSANMHSGTGMGTSTSTQQSANTNNMGSNMGTPPPKGSGPSEFYVPEE